VAAYKEEDEGRACCSSGAAGAKPWTLDNKVATTVRKRVVLPVQEAAVVDVGRLLMMKVIVSQERILWSVCFWLLDENVFCVALEGGREKLNATREERKANVNNASMVSQFVRKDRQEERKKGQMSDLWYVRFSLSVVCIGC